MENEIVKVEQYEILPSTKGNENFDVQIATAKRYPRELMRVVDNAIAIVVRDEKTASTCSYSLPKGGKQIKGPSVHLARIIAQLYGNLRMEVYASNITATTVSATAVAFDLESNYAVKIEAVRKILDKYGKRYNEDMVNTTMQAAMAVAERNAIFKIIPKSIIDQIYEAAQRKLTGDLSTEEKLIAKRKEVISFFKKTYDVEEKEILKLYGKQTFSQITAEDIASLRGFVQALKDGDTTIDDTFDRVSKVDKNKNKLLLDDTETTNI